MASLRTQYYDSQDQRDGSGTSLSCLLRLGTRIHDKIVSRMVTNGSAEFGRAQEHDVRFARCQLQLLPRRNQFCKGERRPSGTCGFRLLTSARSVKNHRAGRWDYLANPAGLSSGPFGFSLQTLALSRKNHRTSRWDFLANPAGSPSGTFGFSLQALVRAERTIGQADGIFWWRSARSVVISRQSLRVTLLHS